MSVSNMNDRFDVVIVGARCAGSPLALFLHRAGLSVCVVDAAGFPSDTLSTHMFQLSGIEILNELGVFDSVLKCGAPPIRDTFMKFEDADLSGPPRLRPNDIQIPMLCVRRIALDIQLVRAVQDAGIDLRLHRRVTGLVERNGRVRGVTVQSRDGKTSTIEADLVVGADGRASTIARLTGARRYHVMPSERISTWAYFRNVPAEPVARVFYYRKDDDFIVAAPADDGHFIAVACPSLDRLDSSYRTDSEGWFMRTMARCKPVGELLAGAERVTKFRGLTRFEGFFREATGPGWVLAGDAGHFKDPTPGQGISDALRQVKRLSQAIVRGIGDPNRLDRELHDWWRWRDRDGIQHHWFSFDVGRGGPLSPVMVEILRGISRNEETRKDFLDIFIHRQWPRNLFGLRALLGATGRLLANPARREGALADAMRLIRVELDRRTQGILPRMTERDQVDEVHLDHQPSAA
jgi:2-polyprenyl-6-methoxyphenol hydroxylase-like FAD-dependent oxidoreductase